MPRTTFVASPTFRAGLQTHSPENESVDLCLECQRSPGPEEYIPSELVDTEWVDYYVEHPFYELEDYRCRCCGRLLTAADN